MLICRTSCARGAKAKSDSALGALGALLASASAKLSLAAHLRNSNTVEGSARNIAYHYDAGAAASLTLKKPLQAEPNPSPNQRPHPGPTPHQAMTSTSCSSTAP